MSAFEYPAETIQLPSRGWFYPKDNPLSSGSIEIYYLTARHEDILTSTNLIQKGIVFDKLLEALIVNKDIRPEQLLTGDKDAILVAARIMGYGKNYRTSITCPKCREENEVTIDLQELKDKDVPLDEAHRYRNEFPYRMPQCKYDVMFKFLTHGDEKSIDRSVELTGKNQPIKKEVTTRMATSILAINGDTDPSNTYKLVEIIPAMDARAFREHVRKMNPGLDMSFDFNCQMCDAKERMEVPIGVGFFWPNAEV